MFPLNTLRIERGASVRKEACEYLSDASMEAFVARHAPWRNSRSSAAARLIMIYEGRFPT